jgi:hypothetical protein
MEKMNSKKVGKVIGAVLAVFLLAMVMQPSIVSAQSDQGAIEISRVSLNFVGLEDWFDVKPGELLEARVCYDYLYPWHLQKHEYRVVVGYDGTALFCIDEEIRREYPGNTGDGSDCTIFTIKAPVEPGIYSIYKTYTKGLTCSEAKEHYELNGGGNYIIAEPGKVIGIEIFYEFLPVSSPREYINEVVIGFEDEPLCCLVGPFLDEPTNIRRFVQAYEIIAPSELGIYHVMIIRIMGYSCEDAKKYYRENPSKREIIGTIEVIDEEEENEKWSILYQGNYTLKDFLGKKLPYTIIYSQCGAQLRVDIQTPGVHEVETGEVLISVAEDVHVRYDTGGVSASRFGLEDRDFFEIKQVSSAKSMKAFFDLAVGLIPYSGAFAGSINLGKALYEDTKSEFKLNEDLDLWNLLKGRSNERFTTNNYQNDRDVITIPWVYSWPDEAEGIRVHCPEMLFPESGEQTVVFCVAVNVHNAIVRHYIALPIEIGKQRMEA